MQRIKIPIFVVLISIACLSAAQNQRLEQYLDRTTLDALIKNGELREDLTPGSTLKLVPRVSASPTIRHTIEELNPTAGVEILSIHTDPRVIFDAVQQKLLLYNTLRSISALDGLQYFSKTRRRMRKLIESSYVVDSIESREARPDPIVEVIPEQSEVTIYQEDTTYGKNVYRVQYSYPGDHILMAIENLTTLRYLLLASLGPAQFRSYLLVIPVGNSIVLYGASCTRLALAGFRSRLSESLYNRLKALQVWFVAQLPPTHLD